MTYDAWKERGRALEESFFHGRNKQLLNDLRDKLAAEEKMKALSEATGISDSSVLSHLVALHIDCETIAAIALVPVVAVAWADGTMDEKEREAITKAGLSEGLVEGCLGQQLVEGWLDTQPSPELLETWKDYISILLSKLDEQAAEQLRDTVIGRAKRVARAAGGMLGVHAISNDEQKVLDELSAALSH